MPSFFPTTGILRDVFNSQAPYAEQTSNPSANQDLSYASKQRRFSAWSAVDDMKSKAGALSDEAQKEISKASATAQAKTGQIELYSPRYYAACTFGGLAACVSILREQGYRAFADDGDRGSHIRPSHRWTWSSVDAKSIRRCTRAISKHGGRLAVLKVCAVYSLVGRQPSLGTR